MSILSNIETLAIIYWYILPLTSYNYQEITEYMN